jgi:plastocyanin
VTRGSKRRRAVLAALCSLAPPLLARAADTVVEVTILNYQFKPARLTVKAGTTVKWVNAEKRTTHSVLFTGPGGFESERLFPGESWQRRFDRPGSHPYGCGPHPEMKGLVEVTP